MIKIIEELYSDPKHSDYSEKSSNVRFEHLVRDLSVPNVSILDYGCGPGNMVSWFLSNKQTPKYYYGYDVREKTIAFAKQNLPSFKFETTLPTDELFDMALFAGTISYAFDEDIDLCKNFYRKEIDKAMGLLKTDGIIRGTVRKAGYEYAKNNKRMITYTENELQNLGAKTVYNIFDHEWFFEITKQR